MHNNGISHATEPRDLDGIATVLKWLSYMPKAKGAALPERPFAHALDPVDREIAYLPTKAPYDPRWMLDGRPMPNDQNVWESGFFDRGSWQVILSKAFFYLELFFLQPSSLFILFLI